MLAEQKEVSRVICVFFNCSYLPFMVYIGIVYAANSKLFLQDNSSGDRKIPRFIPAGCEVHGR